MAAKDKLGNQFSQHLFHGTPHNIPIGGVVEPREAWPGDRRGALAYAGKKKVVSEGYGTYDSHQSTLPNTHPAYKPHPAYVNGPQGQLFGNVYNVEPVNEGETPVTDTANEQGFRGGLRVTGLAGLVPHHFGRGGHYQEEEESPYG